MDSNVTHLPDAAPLDPYDQLPYNSKAIPQAHPSKLAAVARLFGVHAQEPSSCRLLDVGCADGAHLLPLALEFPEAQFVGIDLSAEQVACGNRAIAALGLKNIRLHCADFSKHDFGPDGFDYVIAHGLYSWIPMETRLNLLRSVRSWIGTTGIGYLSYNTLPGAFLKSAVRQIGLELVEGSDRGVSNVSQWRLLAARLSSVLSSPHPLTGALKNEFAAVAEATDSLVAHDWFGSVNDPVSFLTFAEQLTAEGLQYLTEAELKNSPMPHLSPAERRFLAEYGTTRIRQEACLDVMTCKGFRQSLVVGAEVNLASSEDRTAIRTLWLTSDARLEGKRDLQEGVLIDFVNSAGTLIQIGNAWVKSALSELVDIYPQALGFDQLVELVISNAVSSEQAKFDGAVLQDALFELSLLGFVDLRVHSPRCRRNLSEFPLANPVARWQASHEGTITNQHHVPITIKDKSIKVLIALLDGTSDHASLLEKWQSTCVEAGLPKPSDTDLNMILNRLLKFALLVE